MDHQTTEQVEEEAKHAPNPTGKGGFAEHPENINAGGRPKNQESFVYWLNYFKNLSVAEFKKWPEENPENERTMAAELAFARVFKARKQLAEFKEVADRTEGKPKQPIEMNADVTVTDISNKELAKTIRDIITKDDKPDQNTSDKGADTEQVQE